MTMTIRLPRLCAVLIASTLSLTTAHTLAQTPAAKPSVKKQGKADKLQTKEELRACMALRDSNNARIAELDKKAEENSRERQALLNAPKDTGAADARAQVEADLAVYKAADAKVAENIKLLKDWDVRKEDFDQRSKIMSNADRAKKKLDEERTALMKVQKEVEAEREAKYKVYEAAIAKANAAAGTVGNAAAEWNKKNAALVAEREELQASRDKWLNECGNRRYIDTDETEIKNKK